MQSLGRPDEATDRFLEALRIRPEFAMARNNLGTSLLDQGRADEAVEAFRMAVELDANLADARANLGQALVDSGEAEQGLTHCREAVRLRPDLAAGHNNVGNACRALERWAEAHAAFAEAVRLAPDLPRIHANRGLAFHGDGRFAEAVTSFRQAVELSPDDADLWQSLANAHADAEDYATAIPWHERLVALRPERARAHNGLGWALQQEGRHDEAADSFRRALEIRPGLMDALLNRGNLHEVLGEMAEAEACYRQVLHDNPDEPKAMGVLATLLRGRLPDPDREAMTERLGDPNLADEPRGDLLFAMAQVHDARGDHREAAACLEEANGHALRRRNRQGRRYEPAEHSTFVDRLIESFTPELFARLAGSGDPTSQPIFVVGMPRSGTTLVEQILASHSRIHGAGELRLVRQTLDAIPALVGHDVGIASVLAALDASEVGPLGRRYLDGVQTLVERDCPGFAPARVVDKMPDNYLYLGLIAVLFPQATLIHVRRDPRDVAFSCWMTNFRSIRWANDPDHLAGRFLEHRRLTDHWRNVLPATVYEVVYERLVDDFEAESRRLVAACGMDWEPACREFHRTERPVRTASVTQVRQPLYRKAVARWEHYSPFLGDLFARLPVG